MKTYFVILSLILAAALCACQAPTPISTPTPSPEPTITPTLAPQVMEIEDLLQNCAALDEQNTTVVLAGKVFLPDETVYGYKGWYGMDLISTSRIVALFQVGSGPNTMDDLPQYFFEENLVIRDNDGRIVRHGHEIQVTGRPIYRADSENRRCEIYVDKVESQMPVSVLQPKDITIEELTNNNNVDECKDLEFTRQFVRLHGELRVDKDTSVCQLGFCKVTFADDTGVGSAKILAGEGANHMALLPETFSIEDLKVWDKSGELVKNSNVNLVGVVHTTEANYCEMIVYEVEQGE